MTQPVTIKPLTTYSPAIGQRVRELLIDLSRSGQDRGPIAEEWFDNIINSPWHDLLLAYSGQRIVGMISISIVMGAGIGKNAYLEDFVTDHTVRGQGLGHQLWQAAIDWARSHGAKRLEFTCGHGREAAQEFYKRHGATVYSTNFFRYELD